MEKPKMHTKEFMDYHEMINWIEVKYGIEVRDYYGWSANQETVEYADYWHFMLDKWFSDTVGNGCFEWYAVEAILEDLDTPEWAREITQLIYNEFKEYIDDEGGISVLIEW